MVEVALLKDVPPGTSKIVNVDGTFVAIFNVNGKIYAIDDSCPHAGGSLGSGRVEGTIVTCRSHGMKIDITNGCFAHTSDFGVPSYPVMVIAGRIMVSVGEAEN